MIQRLRKQSDNISIEGIIYKTQHIDLTSVQPFKDVYNQSLIYKNKQGHIYQFKDSDNYC